MLYTLKNQTMTVVVSDLGAELQSVQRDGCEYLWQGNAEYWGGRAPILFPICGRLFGGSYTYNGVPYEMKIHGFARGSLFSVVSADDTQIVFTLSSSDATRAQYPFDFTLTVSYVLEGGTLRSDVRVVNTGDDVLPFTFGAHPGFNVPLNGEGDFSDYRLTFSEQCSPARLLFSETCFQTGKKEAYPMVDCRSIPLYHKMFDNDAVFLDRVAESVTLCSDKTDRYVRMTYRGFPYLGIWHKPQTEAPYVCIEPWMGLPAYDGVTEEFSLRSDMFRIMPGTEKTLSYEIEIG